MDKLKHGKRVDDESQSAILDCEDYDPRVRKAFTSSLLYNNTNFIPFGKRSIFRTKVSVVKDNVLNVAIQMAKEADMNKVGVLNVTTEFQPKDKNAKRNEIDLYRRSTLLPCLNGVKSSFYPLLPRHVILSPDVFVFRYDVHRNWRFIPWEKTFFTNIISATVPKRPRIDKEGKYYKYEFHTMLATIKEILRASYDAGLTCLILNDFGCEFGHPAGLVASLFRQVLSYREFKDAFESIVFAIDDTQQGSSFQTFQTIFQ